MTVRIKLFASTREVVGRNEMTLELPATATIADVRQALIEAIPSQSKLLGHAMFAVNQEYASDRRRIKATDEVACIPPVSGG